MHSMKLGDLSLLRKLVTVFVIYIFKHWKYEQWNIHKNHTKIIWDFCFSTSIQRSWVEKISIQLHFYDLKITQKVHLGAWWATRENWKCRIGILNICDAARIVSWKYKCLRGFEGFGPLEIWNSRYKITNELFIDAEKIKKKQFWKHEKLLGFVSTGLLLGNKNPLWPRKYLLRKWRTLYWLILTSFRTFFIHIF